MYTDVEIWHDGHEEKAGNQCIIAGVIYIVTLIVSGSPLSERRKVGRFLGVICTRACAGERPGGRGRGS